MRGYRPKVVIRSWLANVRRWVTGKLPWYVCVTAFTLLLAAPAKAGQYRFEHVMSSDTQSVAATNAIFQDHLGFMWFAGSNGLARYDGHHFEIFRNDPKNPRSISNTYIWDVTEDHDGVLWVATPQGLNRFDRSTQTFERFQRDSTKPNSLVSNDAFRVVVDSQNQLWVGTRGGLDRFNRATGDFTHYYFGTGATSPADNGGNITVVYEDAQQRMWVGLQGAGAHVRPAGEAQFTPYQLPAAAGINLAATTVRDIKQDELGNLWIGTSDGLLKVNESRKTVEHFKSIAGDEHSLADNDVWGITVDRQGNVWIAGTRSGLTVYRRDLDRFDRYVHNPYDAGSVNSNQVRQVFQDKLGDYWVGLFPVGTDYINAEVANFSVYHAKPGNTNSLPHDALLSMHDGPGGKVWIGSEAGLSLFDEKKQTFVNFQHDDANPKSLSANPVQTITQDIHGDYWFGTWSGGLNRFNAADGTFEHFKPDPSNPNSVSSAYIWGLMCDRAGNLWIGTEAGSLDKYNLATKQFTHYAPNENDPKAISGRYMRAILQDSDGDIWVGTLNGLNRYNPEDESFTRFQHKEGDSTSLPNNWVSYLYQDSRGGIWVATENGVSLMDKKNGVFTNYNAENGLANNVVTGIAEDKSGQLWFSTLDGLSRFNPYTKTFLTYTKRNGLAGNITSKPAIHAGADGLMYVGSTQGLAVFDPAKLLKNTVVPPVFITDLKIFNKSIAVNATNAALPSHIHSLKSTRLTYKQSMFAFDFAALNFRNPEVNQYKFKMEGFDQNWIEAGHARSATYTNLNPGQYTFHVIGSNNNGVWNDLGASIHVEIAPPPWRTWWAYGIYGLASLGVLYLFIRSQRIKVQFEKQKVEQLREVNKLKDEFLANTSHELRTPLNGIIGITEALIDDENTHLSARVLSQLRMIAASGRRLSNLVNDLLDFSRLRHAGFELKIRSLNLVNLCNSVVSMTAPMARKKNLQVSCEFDDSLPRVAADEERLEQILYNLVGNAIKFTLSGFVKISARIEGDRIVISIADSGIGIPASAFDSIFESFSQVSGNASREFEGTGLGLAVTKNLVELHGGKIDVASEVDRGSTFTFDLPIADVNLAQVDISTVEHRLATVKDLAMLDQDIAHDLDDGLIDTTEHGDLKAHILLVDDDTVNRQVLISQLGVKKYYFTEAKNGQAAIDAVLNDFSIDLVLLDVMMPRMTGYEAAQRIREIRPRQDLPIIFITAKHFASDLVTGFRSGGNDFLTKPVSKQELLSRTKTHLDLSRITRNLEKIVEERTSAITEANLALEAVNKIINLINQQTDIDGLVDIMLQESVNLLDTTDYGAFWLLDDASDQFKLMAVHAQSPSPQMLHDHFDAHPLAERFKESTVTILGAADHPLLLTEPASVDAVLVVPIRIEEKLTGILSLVNQKGTGQFDEKVIEALERLQIHAVSAVSKARMLEVLKMQNNKLEETSFTDQLTGLHNRRHLIKNIGIDLSICMRKHEVALSNHQAPQDADVVFMIIDIDHFKMVNDIHGHAAGDTILKQFATLLLSVFRESDYIVRWGGEEFMVVLRFCQRADAAQLAERFRAAVEHADFDVGAGVVLHKTCSIGFACFPFYCDRPEDVTWEQVVEIADKALYAAKKTTRNAWVGIMTDGLAASSYADSELLSRPDLLVSMPGVYLQTSISPATPITWS